MRMIPIALALLGLSSCNAAPPAASSLAALDNSEVAYSGKVCQRSGASTSRVSLITVGGQQFAIVQPDACYSTRKASSLALNGRQPTSPAPRPVMIMRSYVGNTPSDQFLRDAHREAIAAATQAGYRVLDVSNLAVDEADRRIRADRKANPTDYSPGGHILINMQAHGEDPSKTNGIHRVVKENQTGTGSSATYSQSSMRSTDVMRVLLNSVGDEAGHICTAMNSCYGGAVSSDEQFAQIKNNKNNPKQVRTFIFETDDKTMATTTADPKAPYDAQVSNLTPAFLELMRGGNEKGLTLESFERRISGLNHVLSVPIATRVTTMYASGPGISDSTGLPAMTPSHARIDTLDHPPSAPGPFVVTNTKDKGDVYVVPPGLRPVNLPRPATKNDAYDYLKDKALPQPHVSGPSFDNGPYPDQEQ